MAQFVRNAGDPLTPIEHSNALFHNQLKLMSLKGMYGTKGSGAPIIMDTSLKGKAGETIRYTFIPFVKTKPLRGQDVTILGNERSWSEFPLDLTVDEVNFPYKRKGKMTEQRVLYNTRQEMSRQISNDFSQYTEDTYYKVWTGAAFNDDSDDLENGASTINLVNGEGRCIRADNSTDYLAVAESDSNNAALVAAMNSADVMNTGLLAQLSVMARTVNPKYKMSPIRIGKNNEEFFILFISPQDARNLQQDVNWVKHSEAIGKRGLGGPDDYISNGALGVWRNIIVKESERITRVDGGGGLFLSRNIMVGKDSLLSGWAQTLDYTEEMIDHNRQLSANGSEIRGEKKVTFDGVDLGVAQIITAID